MPWKECHVMDERLRFVARLLEGEKMAALCAEFGISRKTGYKIYDRYKDCGVQGLTDRSRRPQRLERGDLGTVIQVYADGKAFEVEFMTLDGRTAAVRRGIGRSTCHRSGHFAFAALAGFLIGRARAMQPLADARHV